MYVYIYIDSYTKLILQYSLCLNCTLTVPSY